MRKIISIPTKPEILKQNLGLIETYKYFIFFCMIYQGFTEYYFFSSLFDFNFLGGEYLGMFLALCATIGLETVALGSLIFVVQSCYQNKNGFNIQFLMPLSVGLVLYFASGYISFIEVPAIVEKFTTAPTLSTTVKIDSKLNISRNEINNTYSNDSTLIASNWNNQISNSNRQYASKIQLQKSELKKHKRNKKNGSKWAQSWIDKTNGLISSLRVEKEIKEGELLSSKNMALAELLSSKTMDLKDKKVIHRGEKKIIDNKNLALNGVYSSTLKNRNNTYRFIVFFTILVILLCNIFILSTYYKAGVTVSYQLRQSNFDQSLIEKWIDYLMMKYVSVWHYNIDEKRKSVKPSVPSDAPHVNVIYKNEDFTQYKNPYELAESQQNMDDNSASFPVAEKSVLPPKQNKNETKVKQKSVSNSSETKTEKSETKNETKAESFVKQARQPISETKVKQKSVSNSSETKTENYKNVAIETIIDKRYLKQRCKQWYVRSLKESSTAQVRKTNKDKFLSAKRRLSQLGVRTRFIKSDDGEKDLIFEE